jgi:hypothetical protein
MSDIMCSAIDSLKQIILPEYGPVWLNHVVKKIEYTLMKCNKLARILVNYT